MFIKSCAPASSSGLLASPGLKWNEINGGTGLECFEVLEVFLFVLEIPLVFLEVLLVILDYLVTPWVLLTIEVVMTVIEVFLQPF